jgi:hypothetical protein
MKRSHSFSLSCTEEAISWQTSFLVIILEIFKKATSHNNLLEHILRKKLAGVRSSFSGARYRGKYEHRVQPMTDSPEYFLTQTHRLTVLLALVVPPFWIASEHCRK